MIVTTLKNGFVKLECEYCGIIDIHHKSSTSYLDDHVCENHPSLKTCLSCKYCVKCPTVYTIHICRITKNGINKHHAKPNMPCFVPRKPKQSMISKLKGWFK